MSTFDSTIDIIHGTALFTSEGETSRAVGVNRLREDRPFYYESLRSSIGVSVAKHHSGKAMATCKCWSSFCAVQAQCTSHMVYVCKAVVAAIECKLTDTRTYYVHVHGIV